MAGALIVTAEMDGADFARLDALRRSHYPPDRNRVPAHLTMFHALPPSAEGELRRRLALVAAGSPPRAILAGLMNLGSGIALRVASGDLDAIRAELVDAFHGSLTSQDSAGWRPHVTIQNKVEPAVARKLLSQLQRGFSPRPLVIAGLGLHRYADGPWETLARYPFRGN